MHVEPAGIQRIGHPADVAALARRVPALVAQDHRNLLAVENVVQHAQAILELLELLPVFLVADGRRQIHFRQLRHLYERELLFEGIAHVPAVLQPLVDRLHQQ